MKAPAFPPAIWNRFSNVFTPSGRAKASDAIQDWGFPSPGKSSRARADASMPRTARPTINKAAARGWSWNCRCHRTMSKQAYTNIHATCVAIGSKGVLLLGPSGCGKSDLALRLIDDGAKDDAKDDVRLVSDDRTLLFLFKGALHAKAPASIKGLLEVRGLGIIQLPVRTNVKIALAV